MLSSSRHSPLTAPPKKGKTENGPATPLWCVATTRVVDASGTMRDVVISGGGGGGGNTGQMNGMAAQWLGANKEGARPVPLAPRPSIVRVGGDIVDDVAVSARGTVVCSTATQCFVASLAPAAAGGDGTVSGRFVERGCFATEAADANDAASNKVAFARLGREGESESEWLVTGGEKKVRLWLLSSRPVYPGAATKVAMVTAKSTKLPDGWSALPRSAAAVDLKQADSPVEGIAVWEGPSFSLVAVALESTELHLWQLRAADDGTKSNSGAGVPETKTSTPALPRGTDAPVVSLPKRTHTSVAKLICPGCVFVESSDHAFPYLVTCEQFKPKIVWGAKRSKSRVQPATKIIVRQVDTVASSSADGKKGGGGADKIVLRTIAEISCGKSHVMCLAEATAMLKACTHLPGSRASGAVGIAAGMNDGSVQLYQLSKGGKLRLVAKVMVATMPVRGMAFVEGGKVLAAVSPDSMLQLAAPAQFVEVKRGVSGIAVVIVLLALLLLLIAMQQGRVPGLKQDL